MDEIEYEENLPVGKVEEVSATFTITLNYTKCIQDSLDINKLISKKDIEDYILENIEEDILKSFEHPYFAKRHTIIEIR